MTPEQKRVIDAAERTVGPVILPTAESDLKAAVRALRIAEGRNASSWEWHYANVIEDRDPGDE